MAEEMCEGRWGFLALPVSGALLYRILQGRNINIDVGRIGSSDWVTERTPPSASERKPSTISGHVCNLIAEKIPSGMLKAI